MSLSKKIKLYLIAALIFMDSCIIISNLISRKLDLERKKKNYRLSIMITVNDSWKGTFDKDTPIFIQCTITNPLEKTSLPLNNSDRVKPEITTVDNVPVSCSLQNIPFSETSIRPHSSVTLTWILSSRLAPGKYIVNISLRNFLQ